MYICRIILNYYQILKEHVVHRSTNLDSGFETVTLIVVDVTLPLMVKYATPTLMVVDLALTIMIVDVSLSNLDSSSAGMAYHIQEPVSISIQNIQIFSRLGAELIQDSCPCLCKQSSCGSMNYNRNTLET